jgi:hypothetical protein
LKIALDYLQQEKYEAVFTPHLPTLGNLEMEVSAMKHGVMNLGFLGLKRTSSSLEFLKWWDLRLQTLCIRDPHRGIFTDQTWAALGMGTLKSKILNEPGYNFATWNLADHKVNLKDGNIFIDDSPLIFAHFSSFSVGGIEEFIKKYEVNISDHYLDLFNLYASLVSESSEKLKNIIQLKRNKIHYKKRRFYQKTRVEMKANFVDYLNKNLPVLLRFLIWAKNRKRS